MPDERPLTMRELDELADLYVIADMEGNLYTADSNIGRAIGCLVDCVPIFDAEVEIVCIAPRDKAILIERLINSCQPRSEGDA